MQKAKGVLNIVIRAASSIASSQQVPLQRGSLQKLLVSCSSGFPKDLRYGVSTVLRKDGYGEDAFFIAHHNRLGDVLGVADGVGGWRDHGVDPSVFSRGLMRHCARLVREGKFSPQNPERLIAASLSELTAQASFSSEPLLGSSTACIVILDRDNSRIYTANLGDSGFLVFRSGRVVHRSEEQTHYFNTPFQLSLPPKTDEGRYLSDSPDSAEISTFSVKEGDLILVATDGLFDNMPVNLIEKEIEQLKDFDQQSLQMACNSIALQARTLAFDRNHMSPFAKKANQYGYDATGGKPDDITVLLAVVSSATPRSSTCETAATTESHKTDSSSQIRSNDNRR